MFADPGTGGPSLQLDPSPVGESPRLRRLREQGIDIDQLRAHSALSPEQRLRLMTAYVGKMRILRRKFLETSRPDR